MATYVTLIKFTEKGVKDIKDTGKRAAEFKSHAKKHGIRHARDLSARSDRSRRRGWTQCEDFRSPDGGLLGQFMGHDPAFRGGVRVAVGDVNQDGMEDIITAPGPGGGPDIRIFDGLTLQMIGEFAAYDPRWSGGVFVAYGLQNVMLGPVVPYIVTGADAGGGPHVKLFNAQTGELVSSFMAYDPNFAGGVRVATLLVGSGHTLPYIVTGAGPGGGPHVKVFPGLGNSYGSPVSFMAYDPAFTGGVYVAGTDNDGVITGAGAGGGPHVKVFDAFTGAVLQSFYAYDPGFAGGVRVGSLLDITPSQARSEIVVGPGPGGGPDVRILDRQSLAVIDEFYAYDPAWSGGVFVGGTG